MNGIQSQVYFSNLCILFSVKFFLIFPCRHI